MMQETSLSYLFAHLDTVGVTFRHPALLLVLGLVPVFFYLGRRTHRRATPLRVAAFVVLTLVLAGFALTARLPSDQLSIVVAVDVSESIDEQGRKWSLGYLNQIAAALAPGDELAVVAFAQNTAVIRPPSSPASVGSLPRTLISSGTDIGRGLDASLALFGGDGERRLVLITDGLESRGNSRRRILRARRAGVRTFALVPPQSVHLDSAVVRVSVAPVVGEGSIFPLRVIARNQAEPRSAELSLYADDQPLGRETVSLQTGLNAIEIPLRMTGEGSHHLRVELHATGDDIRANDRGDATVMVVGKTRALLITSDPRSPLARALTSKEVDTDVRRPKEFPDRLEDLLNYHCVILQDAVATGFRRGRLALLERYVRDFGGGLVFIGSDRSYGAPRFKGSVLDRLLPVTLEPRRPRRTEREPLALFILIDRSNSMGYNSRIRHLRDGEKLRYAREAALAVTQQLKDHDLVGVIAFDSQPFPLAPLRPLRKNRKVLEDTIPRLTEGGGTDFYDALDSARAQLSVTSVSTRHVILLTDGDTNRGASDHYPLMDELRKSGISVTTIRIGGDTVNLTLLNDISAKTGGQFYHVENVEALPQLMLRDTSRRLAQAPREDQKFLVEFGSRSQMVRGLERSEVPTLAGYAYAKLKPRADAPLFVQVSDRRDPLLASWQYGLGRVVAFTAGLRDDAETWVGWEAFGKFWSQVVRWSVRDQTPLDYAVGVRRRDGKLQLEVRSFDRTDDGALLARVRIGDDKTHDIPLVPVAPRVFSGWLPALDEGQYALTVVKRRGVSDVREQTVQVVVPGQEQGSEERFAPVPDAALLADLTEATGGKIDPSVRELVARKAGTQQLAHGLDYLLIPLAMVLFLGDVAARRMILPPSEAD